jgi:glucose/arabinose dehydrogenase
MALQKRRMTDIPAGIADANAVFARSNAFREVLYAHLAFVGTLFATNRRSCSFELFARTSPASAEQKD